MTGIEKWILQADEYQQSAMNGPSQAAGRLAELAAFETFVMQTRTKKAKTNT